MPKPSPKNLHTTFFSAIMDEDRAKIRAGVLSAVNHGALKEDPENTCNSMLLPFSATAVDLFQTERLTTTTD